MNLHSPERGSEEQRWIEAVEWHALRCSTDGLTASQHSAWRLWSQDAENRRIYAACARLYVDAQRLEAGPAPPCAALRRGREHSARPVGWNRWRAATATVLISAAAGVVLLLGRKPRPVRPVRTAADILVPLVYRTAPGQTRRLRLGDGSTVILGGETAITVSLNPQRRAVRLEHGEAWFQVVHRPHWPFTVSAGNGIITDLGTAFVVDRESGRVEVTVTQGEVEVAVRRFSPAQPLQPVNLQPIPLRRGERIAYGQTADEVVRTVSPRLALAWTRGELEFSDEPLGAVVANVNRYTVQPIEVTPAAGRLRLTTLVLSRHISGWLAGLDRVLPVRVTRQDAEICIRLRGRNTPHLDNTCQTR